MIRVVNVLSEIKDAKNLQSNQPWYAFGTYVYHILSRAKGESVCNYNTYIHMNQTWKYNVNITLASQNVNFEVQS